MVSRSSFVVAILQLCLAINCLIGLSLAKCTESDGYVNCDDFDEIKSLENKENVMSLNVEGQKTPLACVTPILQDFPKLNSLDNNNGYFLIVHRPCFEGLTDIKSISLNANKIVEVDFATFNNSDIRAIFLNNNFILKANFEGVRMPEVVQLELYGNLLEEVTITTRNMPKVNNIYLGENKITRFRIENENVQKVDLQSNRIKTFNGDDLKVPNADTLYLNNNNLLFVVPEMFANAPKVEQMFLAHNLITRIDFPRRNLITAIDVRYNKIRSMNDINFKYLKPRNRVDFSSNRVYELESQNQANDKIESFTCNQCSIHVIHPEFFPNFMRNLTQLDITSNHLNTLSIFSSTADLQIEQLNLGFNFISKIRANDLEKLPRLQHLTLSFNKIETVEPGAFDKLTKLETLALDYNCIQTLPDNLFDGLSRISSLVLWDNLMTYFPIPGWNEETNSVKTPKNHPLLKIDAFFASRVPYQCSCYELLLDWMRGNFVKYNLIKSTYKSKGNKPVCIATDAACTKNYKPKELKRWYTKFRPAKYEHSVYGQCDL